MQLLNMEAAATHCGLQDDLDYFRHIVVNKNGPDYLQPSPRRIYFTVEQLDKWMSTWHRDGAAFNIRRFAIHANMLKKKEPVARERYWLQRIGPR